MLSGGKVLSEIYVDCLRVSTLPWKGGSGWWCAGFSRMLMMSMILTMIRSDCDGTVSLRFLVGGNHASVSVAVYSFCVLQTQTLKHLQCSNDDPMHQVSFPWIAQDLWSMGLLVMCKGMDALWCHWGCIMVKVSVEMTVGRELTLGWGVLCGVCWELVLPEVWDHSVPKVEGKLWVCCCAEAGNEVVFERAKWQQKNKKMMRMKMQRQQHN